MTSDSRLPTLDSALGYRRDGQKMRKSPVVWLHVWLAGGLARGTACNPRPGPASCHLTIVHSSRLGAGTHYAKLWGGALSPTSRQHAYKSAVLALGLPSYPP